MQQVHQRSVASGDEDSVETSERLGVMGDLREVTVGGEAEFEQPGVAGQRRVPPGAGEPDLQRRPPPAPAERSPQVLVSYPRRSLRLQLGDDGFGDGAGAPRVLPGDQASVLDDVGVEWFVGDAVVRAELFNSSCRLNGTASARCAASSSGQEKPVNVLSPDQRFTVAQRDVEQAGGAVADGGDDAVGLVEPCRPAPRSLPPKSNMTPCPPVK